MLSLGRLAKTIDDDEWEYDGRGAEPIAGDEGMLPIYSMSLSSSPVLADGNAGLDLEEGVGGAGE